MKTEKAKLMDWHRRILKFRENIARSSARKKWPVSVSPVENDTFRFDFSSK